MEIHPRTGLKPIETIQPGSRSDRTRESDRRVPGKGRTLSCPFGALEQGPERPSARTKRLGKRKELARPERFGEIGPTRLNGRACVPRRSAEPDLNEWWSAIICEPQRSPVARHEVVEATLGFWPAALTAGQFLNWFTVLHKHSKHVFGRREPCHLFLFPGISFC